MSANDAYITGVGQSEIGVKLTRSPLLLTVDAVREALERGGTDPRPDRWRINLPRPCRDDARILTDRGRRVD